MTDKLTVNLSHDQDGYGFYYGHVKRGDDLVCNVNLLPPAPQWSGDIKMEGYEPHPTEWIVFADGEELARISERGDIDDVLTRLLT